MRAPFARDCTEPSTISSQPSGERSEDLEATAEAVADAVGFCAHHGCALGQQQENVTARVLGSATDRVIELLSDERRNAERLVELFFAADRACPGCKLHEQQVTRQIHRLRNLTLLQSSRWFCSQHYRKVAYTQQSPALPALVHAQLELLRAVATAINKIAEEPHADTQPSPHAAATLSWAFRVVAGDSGLVLDTANVQGTVAESVDESRGLSHAFLDDDRACPVCAEIGRAEQRWSNAVKVAARLGQDLWTVFPTCPVHLALCARFESHPIAVLAARYGATAQCEALRRGSQLLARDHAKRIEAAKSVFNKPQSLAYVLGQQRKMITSVPRCPACARAIVAQERAIVAVVRRFDGARRRGTLDSEGELCLKHFATAYLLVSRGAARSTLVARQIEMLRELRARLARAIDSSDAVTMGSAVRNAIRHWTTAMRPPSGHC